MARSQKNGKSEISPDTGVKPKFLTNIVSQLFSSQSKEIKFGNYYFEVCWVN